MAKSIRVKFQPRVFSADLAVFHAVSGTNKQTNFVSSSFSCIVVLLEDVEVGGPS